MKIEKAIEIINRKTSIPEQGESFEDIEEAFNMATKALEKQLKFQERMDIKNLLSLRQRIDNIIDTTISEGVLRGRYSAEETKDRLVYHIKDTKL